MLPREKREAAFAVYAFCRHADDLADRGAGDPRERLVLLGGELDRIAEGQPSPLPFAPALAWAFRRFGLETEPFHELIEGVLRDRGPVRIETWPELRDYCYHVASVVGLIMARIFELRDEAGLPRAVDLGIAMQLTNILRDIREDLAMDRIYLPSSEMAEFCIGEADIALGEVTPDVGRFLDFQIARARDFYRSGEKGIPLLADDGSQLAAWMMSRVYGGILDEIERRKPDALRRRAATSLPAKLRLAFGAWLEYRRRR
jgi:phytoene synthase